MGRTVAILLRFARLCCLQHFCFEERMVAAGAAGKLPCAFMCAWNGEHKRSERGDIAIAKDECVCVCVFTCTCTRT